MKLFKENYLFVTFKIKNLGKDSGIPPFLMAKVKRMFWWRRKKIQYFEPHTGLGGYTTIVMGSAKVADKTNRNVVVFLLELYAQIKSDKQVTEDFTKKIKIYKDFELTLYKVPKFYWDEKVPSQEQDLNSQKYLKFKRHGKPTSN